VGLRGANLEEKEGLFGPLLLGSLLSFAFDEGKWKWLRNGRSFVPPRRLNARVRGVMGLSAPGAAEEELAAEGLALSILLRDMAGSLDSRVGESREA